MFPKSQRKKPKSTVTSKLRLAVFACRTFKNVAAWLALAAIKSNAVALKWSSRPAAIKATKKRILVANTRNNAVKRTETGVIRTQNSFSTSITTRKTTLW